MQTTKHYYEQRAEEYVRATGTASHASLITEFLSELDAGTRIIDLGCGGGRDLSAFRRREFDAIGLDYSEALLRLARQYTDAPLVLADMQQPPFGNGTFGAAWALASLLHLPREKTPLALSEVWRILRPGGFFFSSVKSGSKDGPDQHGRWFSYFGIEEWSSTVSAAKFDIIKVGQETELRQAQDAIETVSWVNCLARRAG
jgi:SAM-dependent methyltransferase